MKSKGDEMGKKTTAANVKQRMRKIAHNTVAVLVTLSLVWWQTPVYAMADEGTSPQSQAPAEVQSGEKTGGTTQEAPQANTAADKPASEDEPGSSDLEVNDVPQPEAGGQEQAGAEKQEATAQEQEQAKDEAASQDKATAATEDKGQAEAEKKQEEAEPQKEPAVWTIKFDANASDATGTADALENVTEDKDTVKLPKEPYKREGYKFLGWNTAADPKAPGVEPKDALFVPDEVQLYNLSYNYVVLTKDNATEDELKAAIQTTDGKLITIVGDDAKKRGTDDKGRKVETCDLQALLKDKALTLYAQWEKIPDEKAEGNADDGKENKNPEGVDEKVGTDGTGVVESDDIVVTTEDPEAVQEELDPLATSDIFTTNSGFNTVNADGTVTDADGYQWLIAPDDELDEEAAEGEGNGEGATADADENPNGTAAEGDKANAGDADKKENPGEVKDSAVGDAEATAALDKAIKNRDALENGTGVKLFGLRLLGADPVDVTQLPQEGDGSKIEAIRVKWVTQDTPGSAYVSEADRLSLVPGGDSDQAMKFQVEFALSGQYDYSPGDVEFRIPATIWKDHNGNPVGYMTLSVPEAPETGAEFAYRLVDGEYIITNTRRLPAASKAAFQFTVRGITPHKVYDAVFPVENYPGGEAGAIADGKKIVNGNVVDANVSAAIQPTITVTTHEGNTLSLTAMNAIDATIDTSERITRATKSGELFENTPSNLPSSLLRNLPTGTADDYLYVRWQTYCYHSGNQVFTLNVNDGLQGAYEQLSDGGQERFDDGGVILGGLDTSGNVKGRVYDVKDEEGKVVRKQGGIDFGTVYGPDYHSDTSYLYDHLHYVWAAYPKYMVDENGNKKERFEHGHVYVFQNQADWSLTGADDNITTTANPPAQGTVRYAPQKFIAPDGDYATHKWTESVYKDYTYGYFLDQLRAEKDPNKGVEMNFRVQTTGHTLKWTLGEGLDPDKQENYGQRAVKFVTYDDDTYFNYDWETPITHEDFEFVSIRFATPSMSNYGKFANGSWGYMNTSDALMKPDIDVYGQIAEGSEVHFATISWKTGKAVAVTENGATGKGDTITFPKNVTDVRHEFETTAAAVTVDAYPKIRLKASDRVKQLVEQLYAESEFPVSKFQNNVHMDVSYADGGNIGSMADQSRATLTGTTLAISSEKNVVCREADYDVIKRRATLHYTAKVYEQTNIESRAQYDDAVAADIIPAETSGTWYDLLPLGVVPNLDSVKLRNGDAVKKVYTVENYKKSGRTLMVVEADLKPQPTTIGRKYADIPQLTFDAWYSFENMRDLGLTLVNRVAFESGTEGTYGSTVKDGQFGNVKDHMGEKDDPTGKNGYMNNQTKSAVGNDAEILKDLDPNTDKGGFVYAKCVNTLNPDLMTRVSLTKEVMDDSKGRWTTGLKDDEQVTVYPGHPYTYRLRVESDGTSATKGVILFDTLENYVPTYDKQGNELDDYGHPQWRGIFRSVDLTQLEQEGIAPVVYYATEDHLIFEDSTPDGKETSIDDLSMEMSELFGHYDISNTDIWSTTRPDDLKRITAIAIDCSKKTDGTDFILGTYVDENGNYVTGTSSISALVHMVAPVDEGELYGDETGIGTETWATGGSNAIFAAGGTPEAGDGKYNPENNRYAYNNTRLVCTEGDGANFESTRQMIRNDYTRVGILPYELVIKKLWNDSNNNDGKRPDSVTVNLQASWYDSNGTVHTEPAEYVDPKRGPNEDGKVGPITITEGEDGAWTKKVERIKYVNDATQYVPLQYSLTEDIIDVNGDGEADYRYSAQQGNRDVNGGLIGNQDNYITVVNTHDLEKVSLSGKKNWNDNENEMGVRPGSIKVNLLADGKVVQTKTVTKGDTGDWSYSFGKLNKYYKTHEIVYTVTEEYIPKYSIDQEASNTERTDGNSSFLLVNKYNPKGDLAIQKKLVNATNTAAEKEFEFTVLLTREKANPNDEDMPVDGEFTYEVVNIDADTGEPETVTPEGGDNSVAFTGTVQSGGTIKIKGGQKAVIKDLPSESEYEVVETRLDGFVQTSATNAKGFIRSGQVVTASFENTYASEGNIQIKALKQLTGHTLAHYQFRFMLYPDVDGQPDLSGNPIRVITNDAPGEDGMGPVVFGALRYTHADDGKDFTYYMVESNTGKPGYTYDDAMYKVVVHVADNGDGTLTCTPAYYQKGEEGEDEWVPLKSEGPITDEGDDTGDDSGSDASGETGDDENAAVAAVPVFHNAYHASGEITLRAWKTLVGRDLVENEFTFELLKLETDEDGHITNTRVIQTKKNTANGSITFDPIRYDENDINKTYLYMVREAAGTDATVEYSAETFGYTCQVIDNNDGTLSIVQTNVDVSSLYHTCSTCRGTGKHVCPTCGGTGANNTKLRYVALGTPTGTRWLGVSSGTGVYGDYSFNRVCDACRGIGIKVDYVTGARTACSSCLGTGYRDNGGPLYTVAWLLRTYPNRYSVGAASSWYLPTDKRNATAGLPMTVLLDKNSNGSVSSAKYVYPYELCANPECDHTGQPTFICEKCEGSGIIFDRDAIPTETDKLPVFTNGLKDGSLAITKLVEDGSPEQEFGFRVELVGPKIPDGDVALQYTIGQASSSTGNSGGNSVTMQNGAFELVLHGGEKAIFNKIPAGTAYRVYEETPTGWVLVSQQNTSGSIPALGTAEAMFTNKYEPGSVQVQPFATKTLDGQPAANGRFTFELRKADGSVVESVSNSAGGFVQFSPITYEKEEFEDGDTELTYYITEVEGSDETVTYDTHQEKVTVTVTKTSADDALTAQLAYDPEDGSPGVAAFNNTSVPGELALTKNTTNSSSDPDAEFEFTIQFTNKYGQGVDASSVQWYKTGASGETTDTGSGSESTGDQGAGDGQGGDSGGQNTDNPTPGNGDSGDEGGKAADQPANGTDAGGKGSADEPAANQQNGPANLFSFLAPEKAYADEGSSGVFHATSGQLQGKAYAVFDESDGSFVFFRAPAGTYTNGQVDGTKTYFTGFEEYKTKDSTGQYWYSDDCDWWDAKKPLIRTVSVAEGYAIKPTVMTGWFNQCPKLTSVDLSRVDTSKVTHFACTFSSSKAITSIDLSTFDFAAAKTTFAMFQDCKNLKSVKMGSTAFSNLLYSYQMFYGCSSLTSVDLGGFVTPKLVDCKNMFNSCRSLAELNISGLNAKKVKSFSFMFNDCSSLTEEGLKLFASSPEVECEMSRMFGGCVGLTSLDLSAWDTSHVKNMNSMFSGCKGLKTLDLSTFNTANVIAMAQMFENCDNLTELNISSFDTGNVDSIWEMFKDSPKIQKVMLGERFSFKGKRGSPAVLPTPKGDLYSGNWVRVDIPDFSYSPTALVDAYALDPVSLAGTWVWEFKPTVYTVLLDPQGGTVPNERLYGITDSGVALPAAARPGWTFKGWNTEPDGSGTTFQAGNGRKVSTEGGSTTTLYAQWDISSNVAYTARHHQETVAGGEYTIAETITGADVTDRTQLEPKSYAGFNLNSDKTTEVVSDDGTKVDIDYYYDRVRYTLAFDSNGGEGTMDSLQLIGGVSKQLPANTFTKSGNSSFVGWNTAADGSGTQYVDKAKVINLTKTSGETVTLYAQWATLEETPAEATSGLFKIKLKAGETAHFTNLPAGTTYEIVESNVPAGWKQTGSDGLTGTIPAAGSAVASVTNTYDANGFVALEAHKQLEGLAAESGQFSFKLVDSKGQVQQTTNGAIDEAEEVVDYYENEGTPEESAVMKPNPYLGTAPVRFGDIDYTLAGVLADVKSGAAVANEDGTWTYTYTITEVANEDDKLIQYDGTTVTATVTLRDDGKGKLIPTVAYHYGDAEGNTFVNTVHPGSLSVTKQVANGTQANGGAKFPFTITLVDKVGNVLANKTYAASGVEGIGSVSTDANGVATFELADGETLLIEGLPDGATYAVAEVENQAADNEAGEGADEGDPTGADEPAVSPSMPAGFSNTGKEGDQGVIKAQETSEASFVNTYDAEGTATIGAFKMLTDKNLKDVDPFTFELRNANGDVIQSANNDTEGNVSFAPIEYSLAQILRDVESEAATQVVGEDGTQSWVYQYSVDEYLPAGAEDSPIDGIYYDAHVADVTVTITDNGDGTLSTVVAYPRTVETEDAEGNPITETVFDAIAEFMNTYDDNSVNARFEVQKRFAQATTDTEFEFEMQPVMMGEDNKPVVGDNGLPVVDPSAEPVKATASGFESGSAKATFELGQFFKDGDHYYLVHEATASEGSMMADPTYYLAYVQVKRAAVQPTVFTAYYPVDQQASAYEVMEEGVDKAVFYNNDNARLCFRPLTMAGYTEAAERVSVYPQVRKVLDSPSGILVGGDFSFELATGEGAVIATVANDENGKVAFFREDAGELGLVYEEPGVHEYAIREVIPENATDNGDGTFSIGTTTYDGSTIGLTVTVQEVNGALVAEEVYHDAQGNVIEDPAFVNSQEGIDLVVYKVSRFGGEGLDHCTYALWMVGPNGDVMLAEGTSDATGRIVFPDVTLTSGTKYYFKEVEAPSGHTVDPYRTAYFTLNEAGDGTVLVEETADDGWHSKYDNIWIDQERQQAESENAAEAAGGAAGSTGLGDDADEVAQKATPIKEGN